MTSLEKAEAALNRRIERLRTNLHEAPSENARHFLAQSLVVCVGLGDALNDYVRAIGHYAQRRHGQLKQANDTLIVQHAALLQSGNELLTQWRANPTDRALRQEIDRAQREMATIQKTLRRGADSLQRALAPSMGIVDKLSVGLRRFGEADQSEALKRVVGTMVELGRELYLTQPDLPEKKVIDAAAWQKLADVEIDQAADFYAGYALAGYQILRVLEAMAMAVSENPPTSSSELNERANASLAVRLKAVTARFGTN